MPSQALAEACDLALETGSSLARLWPLVDQERQRADAARTADEVAPGWLLTPGMYGGAWQPGAVAASETVIGAAGPDALAVPVLTSQGTIVLMPIDRRALLRAGAPGVEWPRLARAIQAPERVDAEIVGYLQRVLDEQDTANRLRGPYHLIDVVAVQMRFINHLRRGARGAVRNDLLTVEARYAEFAGWLYQDAGNADAAMYWSDRAMEWAQECGNHALVSYVLMRKSNQATGERDADSAIGLARAAQRTIGPLPPRTRAVAMQQEAQGHGLAADERTCHNLFDEALELAAIAERDQDLGPGRICNEVYIELQRAGCWTELKRPGRAIDLFERQLAVLPAVQHRDRGVYLARLARAYAANKDPEQAVVVGHQALAIGRQTGSARIFAELQRLDANLAHWPDLPAAAQFHEALTAD